MIILVNTIHNPKYYYYKYYYIYIYIYIYIYVSKSTMNEVMYSEVL